MEIVLRRKPTLKLVTFGDLTIDGEWFCFTLEDAIREVTGHPVADWKIKGRTAIPAGRYPLAFQTSPRFGLNTMTVLHVPGFSAIRIHAGNDADDTDGCPLVGYRMLVDPRGSGGSLLDSRAALVALKAAISPAIMSGEAWITIVNP